jgi:hypothetical protein
VRNDRLDHLGRCWYVNPCLTEIAVAAQDGIITLRGTVESFSQRRSAGEDANRIDGVYRSTTSSR